MRDVPAVPTATIAGIAIRARLLLVIALVCGLNCWAAAAQPTQRAGVAVVDFYTPSPLPPVSGIIPEQRAADDLTDLLAVSAGQQVAILSRVAVREAESAIGWQGADVLRFDRLKRLAGMLNVDRLILVTVVVQVFDAKLGRLVSRVQRSAYEPSATGPEVTERLLRSVLERALSSLLPSLVSGSR
jgi:hypothetical protein